MSVPGSKLDAVDKTLNTIVRVPACLDSNEKQRKIVTACVESTEEVPRKPPLYSKWLENEELI